MPSPDQVAEFIVGITSQAVDAIAEFVASDNIAHEHADIVEAIAALRPRSDTAERGNWERARRAR